METLPHDKNIKNFHQKFLSRKTLSQTKTNKQKGYKKEDKFSSLCVPFFTSAGLNRLQKKQQYENRQFVM